MSMLPFAIAVWLATAADAAAAPPRSPPPATGLLATDRLGSLVSTIRAVGPGGAGHRAAVKAWEELTRSDATQLPAILAGLDGAGPLAANWLRVAVDAIAERQLNSGGRLPTPELEQFLRDTRHDPRARRLAYEWLLRVDPAARDRILPGMLQDPSLEMRRDAVARWIAQAAVLAQAKKLAEATAAYRRALQAARDLDQVALAAERLRKLGHAVDLARQLGHVVRWKLIGPFDNTGGKGFAEVYPPEREYRPDASYPGKHGAVKWIDFAATDDFGRIDFHKVVPEEKSVVGYAATEFLSEKRQEVEIRMTSLNALKVWINGTLVAQYPVYHSGSQPDQYVCRAVLQPGRNLILVKVCQNDLIAEWTREWNFRLRICDAGGTAILSMDRNKTGEAKR